MPVPTSDLLLSVVDLETHLHSAGVSVKDEPAAEAAVTFAVAQVVTRLGFDPTLPVDGVEVEAAHVEAVRGVAVRVAAQWFTNPQDRASYSGPEGLSFTASPQMLSKIMSEADRVTLQYVQLRYAPGFA